MKLHFAALLVACLLVVAPVRSEEEIDEKDVLVLTDKSFNETLAKHKYALVRIVYCLFTCFLCPTLIRLSLVIVTCCAYNFVCRLSSTLLGVDIAR